MLRESSELGFTQNLVRNLMIGKPPMLPKVILPIIDVRDVAKCHVIALTAPKISGTRNLLVAQTRWMKEIADYRIPSNISSGGTILNIPSEQYYSSTCTNDKASTSICTNDRASIST